MQNVLKGWLADNTVTVDDKEDQILVLESAGNAVLADVLSEMKKEDTGLREETLAHVVSLYHRVVSRLLLNGYNVNTDLFHAVAQFTGVVEGGVWNPKKNSVYISIIQDKELREGIAATSVKILGTKADVGYILGSQDTATRATDGTATAGRNYRLTGRMLKVVGDDASVGVTLADSKGAVIRLATDMIARNDPSELILLLPANLENGTYTLTVCTQYSSGNRLLKTPRSMSRTITIGDGGGDVEDPTV